MSVVDLSLQAVTTELISFSWPVLGVVSGAQVVITRRVISRSGPPSTSAVLTTSAVLLACCVAIAVDMVNSFTHPLPDVEPGFSLPKYMWFLFTETMWPVVAGFCISQLALFVVAGSRSPRVLASVSLASTLTAGWIVGWWLLLGSRSEVLIQLVLRMPWVLGLIACGYGLLLSTTTLSIGRRVALTRRLRLLRALRG